MDLWYAKIAYLVSILGYIVIRWPHGNRYGTVNIVEDRKDRLEVWLLIGAGLGTTLIPTIWVLSEWPAFAAYPLHSVAFWIGAALLVPGLWLFHRSHVDLGLNWSITLQLREDHGLVENGVYSRIRHPMYSAMTLLGIAQILFLPNWIVGPAYLVSFGVLYLIRVGKEERMMLERFGSEYEAYMRRTGRLVPRFGRSTE